MSIKFDITVVGAGFGGLISAAILAKKGMKVLVLDKHDKAGGFATSFKRKGYEFEVAVHSIEGFSNHNIRSKIFKYLEVDKRVDFLEMDNFYRLHGFKGPLNLPCSYDKAEETLLSHYPCQALAIKTFFIKMKTLSDEFFQYQSESTVLDFSNPMFSILYPNLYELSNVSIAKFLSSLTKNEELRWLLLSNIGFYHNDPSRYPAAFFLINQSHYFAGGAVYTKGGTQRLSDALVEIIESYGGQVRLKSEVTRIESLNSQSVRVDIKPTVSFKEQYSETSKYCVVNAPIEYAKNNLLTGCKPSVSPSKKYSTSATTLYMGLTKPFHDLYPVDFFNFFTEKMTSTVRQTNNLGFSLVDSSVIDDTNVKNGKYTADVVFLDSFERWQKAVDADEYEALKHETIENLIKRLTGLVPNLENFIDIIELGTPKTIERYTNNDKGAAYGFDIASFSPEEAFRQLSVQYEPRIENYENIFASSAWSSLTHGLTGASLAGFQAARTIAMLEGIGLDLE